MYHIEVFNFLEREVQLYTINYVFKEHRFALSIDSAKTTILAALLCTWSSLGWVVLLRLFQTIL